jgi:hypothetical protein
MISGGGSIHAPVPLQAGQTPVPEQFLHFG